MREYYGQYAELTLRKLRQDEIAEVERLQDAVYNAMPDKSCLVLTSSSEFRESLEYDLCIGAFSGSVLAAVTTMVLNRECPRNVGAMLGYKPSECVTYDTTFVHPDFRGRGIQRHFIPIKDAVAVENGAKYAFATVSPDNMYSLNNVTAVGFKVLEKRVMYGGYERYILRKDLLASGKED